MTSRGDQSAPVGHGDDVRRDTLSWARGVGGILSTTHDMTVWERALYTGQLLPPEQQAELENFRKTEAEAKRELKEVRKNLRKDIDSLENTLKWANIAGMPVLVSIVGIALAIVRKQRTKAQ